ncbi:ABC-2 type transport system ATP-binding protein [Micromonospora mirobrigensis]|uniref:ABC-2 type transport system ATP-binding protein n=1 Tax=Micromonospora mirobrigensis TaxID=262898 RepID=A0A1C5A7K5_9ACTN|nr:ABC-2 type transport system ATP-binding protein [Micromonospora mirobrigensis]
MVALLGPNGAGKTTAISLMLGLAPPDTGTVTLFGGTPDDAVRAGRVGAMLQEGAFVPGATVRDLVELARALYPHPLDTDRVLTVAGLAGLAGRRLDRLSGGEAQRARFAFALAGDPDLLVLDEPAAAMDVAARRSFWTAVREYAAGGRTVLFSTHQLHEADEYADRIVVLAAGRVVADGTPAQIRAQAGVRDASSLDQAFLTLTTEKDH